MQLVNEFSVDAPVDVAWAVLRDIPTVVDCVPGAGLDHVDGDDYHAHVRVKVGPVGMTLTGKATLVTRDDEARQMVVRGSARDRRGNGSTDAEVRMVARDHGGRSVVTVTTDLEMRGRMAQFGQGVITQVGNRIIAQFVERLNQEIAGDTTAFDTFDTTDTAAAPATAAPHPVEDWISMAATAIAGVALGLALGRWADRLSRPQPRG